MRRPVVSLSIALFCGADILLPESYAQAAPIRINQCQEITQAGSYVLERNLSTSGDCLVILTTPMTIDLAGFSISSGRTAIRASGGSLLGGIAVRNGSILAAAGVDLGSASGSIVEGVRVRGFGGPTSPGDGIKAVGIVRGNTVANFFGDGISATGTITGNYVEGSRFAGFFIGQGSTVIGNTAIHNFEGMSVQCPSNVTDNTAVNNQIVNLHLDGEGCNNTNNVAP